MEISTQMENPSLMREGFIVDRFLSSKTFYYFKKCAMTLATILAYKYTEIFINFATSTYSYNMTLTVLILISTWITSISIMQIWGRFKKVATYISLFITIVFFAKYMKIYVPYYILFSCGFVINFFQGDLVYLLLIPRLKKVSPMTISAVFLGYLSITILSPQFSSAPNKLKIDNITYFSYEPNVINNIHKIHNSLPDKLKHLPVDINISKNEKFNGLLTDTHPGMAYPLNFGFRTKVLLGLDKLGNIDSKALIHELTHAYQYNQDYISSFFAPKWKLEGHASLECKSIPKVMIFSKLFFSNSPLEKKYKLFSRFHKSDGLDYSLAQAQAWYYLEYLNFSEEKFFSSKTKLADWNLIRQALSTDEDFNSIIMDYGRLVDSGYTNNAALAVVTKDYKNIY